MTPEEFVRRLSTHVSAGRYSFVLDHYLFPLPNLINGRPTLIRTREDLFAYIQAVHARLLAAGLSKIEGRLLRVEAPLKGRYRSWVELTVSGPAGRQPLAKVIFFNLGAHYDHRIEAVDMTYQIELAINELIDNFIATQQAPEAWRHPPFSPLVRGATPVRSSGETGDGRRRVEQLHDRAR